ncbi:membrane protein insertase YidC [candidate division WWE3 bacterium]|nr:membrane protein insertase YidC [candidate division WWE3 bacterium]
MLGTIWNTILVTPLLNLLVSLYQAVGNLGIAIILMTLLIRAALLPVMLPSLKSMKKQRALKPELDKIREKFKYDKQKQAEKQMELFKQHGINPASGCLTQIVTILILFSLYGVIRKFTTAEDIANINSLLYFPFLKLQEGAGINTSFLYLDLAKPDPYFIFAVLSGGLQFLSTRMTMGFTQMGEKAAKETPEKTDDMAYNMQKQMLYTMPIMNVIVGVTLPSGIVLYMITAAVFSMLQNIILNGPESMGLSFDKMKATVNKLTDKLRKQS